MKTPIPIEVIKIYVLFRDLQALRVSREVGFEPRTWPRDRVFGHKCSLRPQRGSPYLAGSTCQLDVRCVRAEKRIDLPDDLNVRL